MRGEKKGLVAPAILLHLVAAAGSPFSFFSLFKKKKYIYIYHLTSSETPESAREWHTPPPPPFHRGPSPGPPGPLLWASELGAPAGQHLGPEPSPAGPLFQAPRSTHPQRLLFNPSSLADSSFLCSLPVGLFFFFYLSVLPYLCKPVPYLQILSVEIPTAWGCSCLLVFLTTLNTEAFINAGYDYFPNFLKYLFHVFQAPYSIWWFRFYAR